MAKGKWKIQRAFTLIELLVVISIIGILVGLSVFGLQGARKASRDAVRKADLETIRSGLGIYKADCDAYPTTAQFSIPGASVLSGTGAGACSASNVYISSVPVDPVPGSNYKYSSDGVTYHLCASLEQVPSPLPDVSQCGGSCGGTGCNYVATNP